MGELSLQNNNKNYVPFHQHIISLICVAIIAGGGAYYLHDIYAQRQASQNVNPYPHQADLDKLNRTYETILKNYMGNYKKDELIEGAIKGMTASLEDPYSDYLSGEEATNLDATIEGSFGGIGATMTTENNQIKIAEPPIKDSPAEKALLQANDIILKVDGKDIAGQSVTEVVSQIRGKKGTDVTLTIQRADDTFDVTITRDTIPVESVFTELDSKQKTIGKIRISNFSRTTAQEFYTAVTDLREKGAKSFVIDLRQNPGGVLGQVQIMSSMFLEDGKTIVKFESKNNDLQTAVAGFDYDGGFKITEPTVVLVNENSASASEIMAAALHESAGIPVIGTTTFGKGTVQSIESISSASELKLTTAKWLTPSGNWIHEKGFEPSIAIEYPAYYEAKPIDISTTFSQNATGPAVANIHLILNALGYEVDSTGTEYNEQTVAAVKAFQEKQGLEETGMVDPKTGAQIQFALIEKMKKEPDVAYQQALTELSK